MTFFPPKNSVCSFSLVIAILLALTGSVSAAPFLKVQFMAETKMTLESQPDFTPFFKPEAIEMEPGVPITSEIDNVTVTISGRPEVIGGKLSQEPGRLVSRVRGVTEEGKKFPYFLLFRSWIGNNEGFCIELGKLKSQQKYRITFYAYDYADPGVSREGQSIIQDAINPNVKELVLAWHSNGPEESPDANSPIANYSGIIESISSADGRLLYRITPGKGTALLNGIEVEEVK